MTTRQRSLRLRLIAMAALWCAIALAAAWALLSALFADQVRRGFDGNLAAQLDGVIAASEWHEASGPALRRPLPDPRFQQPLSGWYWQISAAEGPLLRSRSLWDGALPMAENSGSNGGITYQDIAGPNGARLRLAARRLTLTGVEGTVLFQLAGDSAAGMADIARFDRLLAVALVILGLGLIGAMVLVVQVGLRPLSRIGQALGDIRAGRADRLQGAFPSEIQPLADEIDTLLDHQAAVIGRARAHAGDLAHALKTPLAVLANEAERDKSALAAQVRERVMEMRGQVDRHLSRARTAAAAGILGARCDVAPVLEDLIRVLGRLHRDRDITIDTIGLDLTKPAPAFAGEREDLQEMLGNLLENACQWASSRVTARVETGENSLLFTIADDGPGLPPEQRQVVMARGARLDESKPGSGLGLAIVADMAELYQGDLNLSNSELGGLSARLKLPLAH